MDVYEAIRDVMFNTHLQIGELVKRYNIINSKYGSSSAYSKLAAERIEILQKKEHRLELKNYSTDVKKRVKNGEITSGFVSSEFKIVKESRKSNWIVPFSVLYKGYSRNNSEIIEFNRGRYSSKVTYTRWEYAPKITSYVNFTQKWVNVNLENKSYRNRYAGKYFHFEMVNHNGFFTLVHTKTNKYVYLTAIDIIYWLPKKRKELNSIVKSKN